MEIEDDALCIYRPLRITLGDTSMTDVLRRLRIQHDFEGPLLNDKCYEPIQAQRFFSPQDVAQPWIPWSGDGKNMLYHSGSRGFPEWEPPKLANPDNFCYVNSTVQAMIAAPGLFYTMAMKLRALANKYKVTDYEGLKRPPPKDASAVMRAELIAIRRFYAVLHVARTCMMHQDFSTYTEGTPWLKQIWPLWQLEQGPKWKQTVGTKPSDFTAELQNITGTMYSTSNWERIGSVFGSPDPITEIDWPPPRTIVTARAAEMEPWEWTNEHCQDVHTRHRHRGTRLKARYKLAAIIGGGDQGGGQGSCHFWTYRRWNEITYECNDKQRYPGIWPTSPTDPTRIGWLREPRIAIWQLVELKPIDAT